MGRIYLSSKGIIYSRHIGSFIFFRLYFLKIKTIFCIALLTLCNSVGTAQGLFTSEREVLRQSRLQWLTMKRDIPRPGNPYVQPFVECVSYGIIRTLEEPYASMDWEIIVFGNICGKKKCVDNYLQEIIVLTIIFNHDKLIPAVELNFQSWGNIFRETKPPCACPLIRPPKFLCA